MAEKEEAKKSPPFSSKSYPRSLSLPSQKSFTRKEQKQILSTAVSQPIAKPSLLLSLLIAFDYKEKPIKICIN